MPVDPYYFRRLGISVIEPPKVAPHTDVWGWLGRLLAFAFVTGFWWYVIWAGTRLWRH